MKNLGEIQSCHYNWIMWVIFNMSDIFLLYYSFS